MTTLTIPQLCLKESSCNSDTTGFSLKGTLYMITEDLEFKRGAIHLVDKRSKQSVPCVVDRFFPRFHKKTVIIKQWNYIYDKKSGYRYIEFETDHAYEKQAELSVLRDHFMNENQLFSTFKTSTSFHTLHLQLCEKDTNLVGKVKAISTILFQSETSIWFLEISDIEDNVSIFINFTGDELIKYHSYFQIGAIYTFQKLQLGNHLDCHFVYTDASTCCTITLRQYDNELIKIQHTYPPKTSNEIKPVTSYTGFITRVIDTLFGIYELDGRIVICLFYYLGYSPDKPYRVKTKLLLNHFHGTVIQGNSNLLKAWQMSNDCPVLVTCSKTHIEIVEFPTHCDIMGEDMTSVTNKVAVYTHLVQKHSTFSQLIRQLELYATLISKFDCQWTSKEFTNMFIVIRNYVFDTTHTEFEPQPNFMLDFVQHDLLCSTMGHDLSMHIMLDEYPTLCKIKSDLVARLQPYELDVVGGNNLYEEEKVDIRYANYVHGKSHFLGLVVIKQDGRVVIKDIEGEIELVTATRLEFGGVYIVRQTYMFEEDLSFKHAYTGEVNEIKTVYLTCDSQDLCLVHRTSAPKFQIQGYFDPYQTVGFNCDNPHIVSYAVVRILEIYPIQTVLYEENKFHLESRILVEVYNWGEQNQQKKHVLIASSCTHTLVHCKSLLVDDWCVISHLDKDENKTYLDQHYVFPISIRDNKIPSSTLIVPIRGPAKTKDPSRNILTVSQVTVERLTPDESYQQKLYMFYTLPVHVRGVVISKKILNGFGKTSVLDSQSRGLYEEHGIGTGKADRNIQIQLRQPDSLDYITIYLSTNKCHYPLGLVPGALVTIRNMVRKPSTGENNITGVSLCTSTIQVETSRSAPDVCWNTETEMKIQDLMQGKGMGEINKTYCSVNGIIYSELKWKCKQCHTVVLRNCCYNMCENAPRLFIASAFVEVSDGYGCVDASIDGERLVFELLRLNEQEKEGIKQIAAEYGCIKYSKSKGSQVESMDRTPAFIARQRHLLGCDLETLFTKAKAAGDMWMHGKLVKTGAKTKRQFLDEEEVSNPVLKDIHVATLTDNGKVQRYYEFNKKKVKVYHLEKANKKAYWYGELLKVLDIVQK